MRRLIGSGLLIASLLRADFDPRHWRFRRPLTAPAGGTATVRIGPEICAHAARCLADLRIVRDGEETPYVIGRGPDRATMSVLNPAPREDTEAHTTILTLDLGASLPHDRVRLQIATPWFHRWVNVESSAGGEKWSTEARAAVYRLPDGESLAVTFPESWDRYLRLRIFNRDDRPLAVTSVALEAPAIRLTFLAYHARASWLYYGNPEARAPAYDLARILEARPPVPVVEVRLGPEQPNPVFRPTQPPWTERSPALLYVVLAAAVAVLGWLTLRFWLRLPKKGSDQSAPRT